MAEIARQITVFWPPALAQPVLIREKKFGTEFFAQMVANCFWLKRMQSGRDIIPFIAHRVTELHTTSTPYTGE